MAISERSTSCTSIGRAQPRQHRQRQPAAQVLAELLQPVEQRLARLQGRMVKREAQVGQAAAARAGRPLRAGRGRATSRPCRSPRRWPPPRRAAARSRVSASSLWADQWPKSSGRASCISNGSPPRVMCRRCSSAEARMTGSAAARSRRAIRGAFSHSRSKLGGVLEQRHLDRLGEAAEEVAVRQRAQQRRVVDHGPGHGEGAEPVLLAEQVDAVLDADAGVGLGRAWWSAAAPAAGRDGRSPRRSRRHRAPPRRRSPRRSCGGRGRPRGSTLSIRSRMWMSFLIASPPGTICTLPTLISRPACAAAKTRSRCRSSGCAVATCSSTQNCTRAG